jgi:DNA adenine methylase
MLAAALFPPQEERPIQPFLKWVGGKRQVLPALLDRAPSRFGTYFEPFLGGGALFFALRPREAVLADVNERLVRTYRGVRDSVEEVIERLGTYPHDKRFFLRMRKDDVDQRSDAEVAAWIIYLNRTCFNGLYRVNAENRFNVAFGRYVNPRICDAEGLRECARALASAELLVGDFADVATRAGRGDFVYFDPPYVPRSATSCFTSYDPGGFDTPDQVRLRDIAVALKARGAHVLLSNSSAPLVRTLYQRHFQLTDVEARRAVNCKGEGRGAITELLITSA